MKQFIVAELDKLQSYKDREPHWIKVYMKFIDKPKYALLPDHIKGQLVSLWLYATRLGAEQPIPFDPKFVANKINATTKIDLEELLRLNFIQIYENKEENQRVHTYVKNCTQVRTTEKKREEKRREENTLCFFQTFWEKYPNHKSKLEAQKKFLKLNPDVVLFEKILKAIEAQKAWRHAKEQAGEWVENWKHPATWLNQQCWEDELEPVKAFDPVTWAAKRDEERENHA